MSSSLVHLANADPGLCRAEPPTQHLSLADQILDGGAHERYGAVAISIALLTSLIQAPQAEIERIGEALSAFRRSNIVLKDEM